jgi:hypothetical protein
MEASYYDNIIEQQRLEPEFFRVGFYGRKFPFFLRVSLSGGYKDLYVIHIIHLKLLVSFSFSLFYWTHFSKRLISQQNAFGIV